MIYFIKLCVDYTFNRLAENWSPSLACIFCSSPVASILFNAINIILWCMLNGSYSHINHIHFSSLVCCEISWVTIDFFLCKYVPLMFGYSSAKNLTCFSFIFRRRYTFSSSKTGLQQLCLKVYFPSGPIPLKALGIHTLFWYMIKFNFMFSI